MKTLIVIALLFTWTVTQDSWGNTNINDGQGNITHCRTGAWGVTTCN